MSELNAIIKKLSARIDNFNAAVNPIMWRDPYEIDKKNKIVTKLFDAVKDVTGRKPSYIGHPWWEDSSLLGKAGMDTVIIGPKGGGLHAKKEWVDIRSVIDLTGILYKTTLNYCNLLP